MTTTLIKIKNHNPCKDVWKELLNYLNKTEADDINPSNYNDEEVCNGI